MEDIESFGGRGKIVEQWRFAEGVWIPKEEGSKSLYQFQIISLLNTESKIFFSLLSRRLSDFFLGNGYIDTSVQKGGVAGMLGCLEHTGVLIQLMREAKESKGALTVLWLDLANAYGSMPHKLVEEALKRHHVSPSVCDLIADYYKNFWLRACSRSVTSVVDPGKGYHYRVYYVCHPILIDYEHACKGSRGGMPRPFV